MLPLVYFVFSPGGLGMKYKVTHISTFKLGLITFLATHSVIFAKKRVLMS